MICPPVHTVSCNYCMILYLLLQCAVNGSYQISQYKNLGDCTGTAALRYVVCTMVIGYLEVKRVIQMFEKKINYYENI